MAITAITGQSRVRGSGYPRLMNMMEEVWLDKLLPMKIATISRKHRHPHPLTKAAIMCKRRLFHPMGKEACFEE
jgi:hypothetical protein